MDKELEEAMDIYAKAKAEGRDVSRQEVRKIEKLMEKREAKIEKARPQQRKGCRFW